MTTTSDRFTPLMALRDRWASLDRVQRGLILLVGARLILALLFMLNVIPLELRYKWYLHHGGDQEHFMNLAESILGGRPESVRVGIGQALVMLPWIALLKPYNYFELVAPLVVINGFILAGLSVLGVGGIARRTTGSDRVALWSAALWAFLPLLAYYSFFWHFDPVNVRSSTVPLVGWLNGLSDGPASFFLIVAVLLLAGSMAQEEPPSFWRLVGVGAALSAAVMFRFHFAPAVAFVLLYVLLKHGWRGLLTACGAGLVTYIPQGWYNQVVFGLPVTSGYISDQDTLHWGGTLARPLSDIIRSLPFNPRNLVELGQYYVGRRPWLALPLALLVAVGVYVVVALWRRRGREAVALLVGVPLAYLLPLTLAWPFRDAILRLSSPTFPFVVTVCVYAACLAWDRLGPSRQGGQSAFPPSSGIESQSG
jgi:hypothetical protein